MSLSFRRHFLLGLAVLVLPAAAAEPTGFARLEDGAIVEVRKRDAELLTYRRADGSLGQVAVEKVDGWLSGRQADTLVDRILPKVGIKEKHGEIRKDLNKLQMAAVPRIVHHLRTGDERRRMEAIAALQFVWSIEAEEEVKAATTDDNESIRRIALRLVQKNIRGDHSALVDRATEDSDPNVSGPALATLLATKPDPQRLAEGLRKRGHWPHLHALLPRYHDRDLLGETTHRMLDDGRPDEQASALCALIHQYDLADATEVNVRKFLEHSDLTLRMRAAEYLRWHGWPESKKPLLSALRAETDPHCRAVLQAALDAMARRDSVFRSTAPAAAFDWPNDFAAGSREALAAWDKGPETLALRMATFDLLRARPFDPVFVYDGNNGLNANGTDPRHPEGRYLELLNRAAGYPSPGVAWADRDDRPGKPPPVAKSLMPPTRDYFDAQRHSFGLFAGENAGPFKNSYHVGDDVAGRRQHEPVVAIGDGVVRQALVASSSWGGIVILEHRDPVTDKRFCSLYSHLGPLVCVQAGDLVAKGQMLGSLGRDYTRATGGYASHLHFGIHLTPYHDPEVPASRGWITGYLSPERFKVGDHAWIDPQPFIRKRLKENPGE